MTKVVRWQGLVVLLVSVCGAVWCYGAGEVVFVSSGGDDAAVGTAGLPLRSLEGARDMLRRRGSRGGAVVWLRGGVYERREAFELSGEDSGAWGSAWCIGRGPGRRCGSWGAGG